MKASEKHVEAAYGVFEEYNNITAEFLRDGVEGLSTPQLFSAVFSALTAVLAKLSINCEVSKGQLMDGVAAAYDQFNWDYHGGNDVTRQ